MDWGNMIIVSREKVGDLYKSMVVKLNIGGDFKKTKKFTWVAETPNVVNIKLLYYDHIITVPSIPKKRKFATEKKDEANEKEKKPSTDFKDYVNHKSEHTVMGIGEPCLREIKIGDSIQFTRRGYFVYDRLEGDTMVFINTPDGHEKNVWI